MSQTLYRKYRPQTFAEIIGQRHIVQTLTNALKNNRIGQAYLFTGPRGTGKTTLARIFAKAVNCEKRDGSDLSATASATAEPCGKCDICKNISEGRSLDIIEIDAASNTGVDNIRELRETIKLQPTQAKYKVYIIDEVHMLSTGAFNALLKTLEEPPAHVIFILATTEIHKVPDTIISRVQRFDFARLPMENIIQKLEQIVKSEGIEAEKEALEMIALTAEGGMRDAESLLSQVITMEDKKITAKEVEEILGTTDHQLVEKMADLLLAKNLSEGLKFLNQIANDGYDLEVFCKSLLNYLRQMLIVSIDPGLAKSFSFELTGEQMEKIKALAQAGKTEVILRIIDVFLEAKSKIKSSFIPQLPMEIAIFKAINPQAIQPAPKSEEKSFSPSLNTQPKIIAVPPVPVAESKNIASEEIEVPSEKPVESGKIVELEEIKKHWNEVLKEIKPLNHSLILFLSNCQPLSIENNRLTIATQYSFYKEKLNERANKLTIEDVLAKILGAKIRINFTDQGYEAGNNIVFTDKPEIKKTSSDPIVSEAMKLFGGKIVEE